MAARSLKGITVEIDGSTPGLQSALKEVNTEIKNTQSQLKDVEKLLKLDPSNTELLAQRQKLLTDAIKETKKKLDTLKTVAESANEQLQKGEISQEQYDALQREIVEAEEKLKSLETQAATTNTTLAKIEEIGSKPQSVGDKISGVGTKLTTSMTVPLVAAGTAAVKTAADFESSMSQVQATMGITADSMSEVDGQSVNMMDTLSALAKEMGATTAFSATECVGVLNYLALADYDTRQICDTLPTVLNLAAADNFDLATCTLQKVLDSQSKIKGELILHSDQGSQYTSKAFVEFCESVHVTQSMSKAGYPYGNAPMERYFNTLKNECTNLYEFSTEESLY